MVLYLLKSSHCHSKQISSLHSLYPQETQSYKLSLFSFFLSPSQRNIRNRTLTVMVSPNEEMRKKRTWSSLVILFIKHHHSFSYFIIWPSRKYKKPTLNQFKSQKHKPSAPGSFELDTMYFFMDLAVNMDVQLTSTSTSNITTKR